MAEGFPYPRGGVFNKNTSPLRVGTPGKIKSFSSSIGEICDHHHHRSQEGTQKIGPVSPMPGLQQAMYLNQEMQKAIRCPEQQRQGPAMVDVGECWADGPNMVVLVVELRKWWFGGICLLKRVAMFFFCMFCGSINQLKLEELRKIRCGAENLGFSRMIHHSAHDLSSTTLKRFLDFFLIPKLYH